MLVLGAGMQETELSDQVIIIVGCNLLLTLIQSIAGEQLRQVFVALLLVTVCFARMVRPWSWLMTFRW